MSGSITLTAAMRANLLSLQQTGNDLATTQLDLSTGNKVNSALDNPVNYFAAQALNSRASSLSQLLDGMGSAVSAIQATSQAISGITTLVNQLTSIANSATQDLATETTQNILAPTAAGGGMASTAVSSFLTAGAGVLTLTPANNTAASFTVAAGENLNTLVSQINATQGFQATIVYGNGTNTLPATASTTYTLTAGLAYLQITSTDGDGTIAATGTAATLTDLGLGAASLAVTTGGSAADNTNFGNVVTQIEQLIANDANYQGTNLINGAGAGGNLTVNFSNAGSSITVNNVNLTTAAAGLNLSTQNVSSTGGITAANTAITAALNTLATTSAAFANNLSVIQARQDFTSNLVNTLQDGATQLTIADKNEEGANLLALQTQQQLGIEALSLSSQANQSVLRLFA